MTCTYSTTTGPEDSPFGISEDPATERQLRFLAALDSPAPPGTTKAEAKKLITAAKAVGSTVTRPEAFGDLQPSESMIGTLASYGVTEPPGTWRQASKLLDLFLGQPKTHCARGRHLRVPEHGHLQGTEGRFWRCDACAQERRGQKLAGATQ